MANWWILIKERFSPGSYIPMILLFTGANGIVFASSLKMEWSWEKLSCVFLLMLSFFFRMRLFDEIKDYEVDLKVNPTRPLARGILTVPHVKIAILLLIIFEVILAATLGVGVLAVHAAAIGYSLLMYEEFFIGDILRPHLTTYAVTHTFVSSLLGLSTGVALTGISITELPSSLFVFVLMNWAFFNLFEFARKTFAAEEERPHVPSYSNIFGNKGALLLSLSQVVAGVALVCLLKYHIAFIIAGAVYSLLSLIYIIKKTPQSAKFFRNISGIYLLVHYALVIYIWRS